MQAERGAALVPAINASVWEQGMSTRIVLFRDWLGEGSETRGLHFAAIQKLNGKGIGPSIESVCAFEVDQYDDTQHSRTLTSTLAPKRKLGDTDFEVADSDDEGYGWDDDEELPPMPSQWQGSEDLLLIRKPGSDDDNEEEDHSVDAHESGNEGP
ncbi:hypothetical protein CHGG_03904 [Chaetomium globosum CBS 148.51]|uniref:Uncharacterized protein n=1 Tax=Chaetomium globosum (strain ATCC 6205 / CBS 148.51 / DSM 1962 / NBRC 6347 / NRRL 1970) TaxID=306901 RepID=Q2H2U2_CHAGB|nr:uncharacterized protein CHGG_03904 [Chaetomium globosum CBS 148.51]EAQ87285.1 hypothetical protein CHGG_03904 [Chaetomium globosum CBS 148.51]